MCNWTKPLFKHAKYRYDECYAKVIFETLFHDKFYGIEIKDKPDLQNKTDNYGIEVTTSEKKEQLKAESLYTDICYNRVRNKEKAEKEIELCGCKLENGILAGRSGTDSFDLILMSFKAKLDKLNNEGYTVFAKNYLCIFSSIYSDERMLKQALINMQTTQEQSKKQFNKVFIPVPGYCYCLDLFKGKFEIKIVDSSTQVMMANKARSIAEGDLT